MDSSKYISVIVPTYNPHHHRLAQTLQGLVTQELPQQFWELIIVDNNSTNHFHEKMNFSSFSNFRILKEERQGLTFARLKGFLEAKGDIIVMVDDDNILDKNYLENVRTIFLNTPALGAAGGKSTPIFEATPPSWLYRFYSSLALRDLGAEIILSKWDNQYPAAAPIGAGMAIRKTALKNYISKIQAGHSSITDRRGSSLSSGGDNDIVLELLKDGWLTGYYPQLSLQHIIPEGRTTPQYLARLVKDSNESWVQLLESHRINPWKKIPRRTLPLRKLKAWISYKAWRNDVNYIEWKGACGLYDGLSQL